jgi:hypothetical protein
VNGTPNPPVRRDRRFIRRNSVPLLVHGVVEYAVGALSIGAPFFFNFDSDLATLTSILLGVAIVVHGFSTEAPTGVTRNLPIASHVVLDYVISLFMIVVPFVFSFTEDTAATAYFILVGVGFLLLTISTRYRHA